MTCPHCGARNLDDADFCGKCRQPLVSRGTDFVDVAPTEHALVPGTLLLCRYRVVRQLGVGGMGRVYLAEDGELGTLVALKVLRDVLSDDAASIKRLKEEARLATTLSHDRIVRVNHFEASGPVKFLVLEYVDGESLAARLAAVERSSEGDVRGLGIALCEALGYAHAKGVLHRDVKPANVLLGRDGSIKLTDFGIARAARDSLSRLTQQETSGTLLYMAPEALDGRYAGLQSDLYSLGATLYEMAAGEAPFHTGDVTHQIMHNAPSPLPQVSTGLNAIVLRLLAKKPEERFESARDVVLELDGTADRRRAEDARRALDAEETRRRAEEEAQRRREDEERRAVEERARLEAEIKQRQAEEEARRDAETARERALQAEQRARRAEAVLRREEETRREQAEAAEWRAERLRLRLAGVAISAVAIAVVLFVAMRNQSPPGEVAPPVTETSAPDQAPAAGPPEPGALPLAASPEGASASLEGGQAQLDTRIAGLPWATIPAGTFQMGCVSGDNECDSFEQPSHLVTLTKPFQLATTEVTIWMWNAYAAGGGSALPGQPEWSRSDNQPAVNADWSEALAFCQWLGGRLPTEAEWEYAARGGRDGWKYVWGSHAIPVFEGRPAANVADENAKRTYPGMRWQIFTSYDDGFAETAPVGSFAANGYGLYDMAGNVWEWVSDWYDLYPADAATDPPGPLSGEARTVRGGSWFDYPRDLRVSSRIRLVPGKRADYVGLRCARDISQ